MSQHLHTTPWSSARRRSAIVALWVTAVAVLTSLGVALTVPLIASMCVSLALSVLPLLAYRRLDIETVGKPNEGGLSNEVEVPELLELLELLDDGLAQRSVQYLIDSGLSPEDATEVVAREFEFSELDIRWLRHHQQSLAEQADDQSVLAVADRQESQPPSRTSEEPPQQTPVSVGR